MRPQGGRGSVNRPRRPAAYIPEPTEGEPYASEPLTEGGSFFDEFVWHADGDGFLDD